MNNRLIPRQPEQIDPALMEQITEASGGSALVARALVRRGVSSALEAQRFLQPSSEELLDPYQLPDMERAVARIREAIDRAETICVYGDYDADGVCSTAMLVRRLTLLGGHVQFYIPNRHSEGYGMNEEAVR